MKINSIKSTQNSPGLATNDNNAIRYSKVWTINVDTSSS